MRGGVNLASARIIGPMPQPIDPVAHNREAWDRQVAAGNEWTQPVSSADVRRARNGDWSIVLIGHEPVPRDWFPPDLRGLDVLCLASGGGQQGPILAAAGANVTVFDNSPKQLEQDRFVAERDGLDIKTAHGDMRDLSAFAAESFDLVYNPVSNLFAPEVRPVWRECFRVLRPGGSLLAGFMNPDVFIFDREAEDDRGELVVRHSLPYADLTHMTEAERARFVGDGPLEYGHTLTDQIGGQLEAGFVITHFAEAPHHQNITAKYMPGYYATRAVKPTCVPLGPPPR
jgi:SAM-dependent methyltransferase